MNGINAATHINKLLPEIHLVMFSSYPGATIEELAHSVGIEAFVAKGDSAKLVGVLQSLESAPSPIISGYNAAEDAQKESTGQIHGEVRTARVCN
jgi:hypothetical protein